MKNINDVSSVTVSAAFLLGAMFLCGAAWGQEPAPELDLEDYQIIGRDTRVFRITGDRISTVSFVAAPVELSEEERSTETSQGLIGNDERIRREERFEPVKGGYLRAEVTAGSRTVADLWGKASLDMGSTGATIAIVNRMAEENTPANAPPSIVDIDLAGFSGGTGTRYTAELGFDRKSEELFGERFRDRDREAGRYRAGLTMRTGLGKSWDVAAKARVRGGGYKDNELAFEEDEFAFEGGFDAVGELFGVTVESETNADYYKLGDDSGTYFSTGARGIWLLWGGFGVLVGANLFVSAMPDEDTEVRFYPEGRLEWALTRSSYVTAAFKPGVVPYSFGDIYGINALAFPVSMAFEDRKIAIEGEYGWRFRPGALLTAGMSYRQSDNSLVFNRFGDFFAVIGDASVDVTAYKVGALYDTNGVWGFDGEFAVNSASWDKNGEVPCVPLVESRIDGYWRPHGKWILRGALTVMGEHHVEMGKNDIVDPFFSVDCGVERELLRYLDLYFNVRNLTNSEGSWWTDMYGIPGTGLYAGLKARY